MKTSKIIEEVHVEKTEEAILKLEIA